MATTFSRYRNGPMDRYELRHIMWTWPILMRQATDPHVLSFAYQMWEKHSNANWLPTLRPVSYTHLTLPTILLV